MHRGLLPSFCLMLMLTAPAAGILSEAAAAAPYGGRLLETLTRALPVLADEHAYADASRRAQILGDLVAVAEERWALLAELAESNPAAVLENALTREDRAGYSPGIRRRLEREVTLEGELQTIIEEGDDRVHMSHFLVSGGTRRSLHFVEEPVGLRSGSRVQVRRR